MGNILGGLFMLAVVGFFVYCILTKQKPLDGLKSLWAKVGGK